MSQKMCLRSDSFEDRFCDDLCEDILQYLPLKDKLRLECVSKQFQRTVFQKQKEIILELDLKGGHRQPIRCNCPYEPNLLKFKYPRAYEVLEEMDPQLEVLAFKSCHYKPIESVLKKCPKIQSINLWGFRPNNSQISKLMLQMITKYCNHLFEFKIFRFDSNECESQEFCRKFGPKLKFFLSAENLFDYSLFPNIETIVVFNVMPLQIQLLQKFSNLTYLTLMIISDPLNIPFKDFPILQNLKDLSILFRGIEDFKGMCDSLEQIAIKCPKLKKIICDSTIVLKNISEVKQLFHRLKAFPSLTRLDIVLNTKINLDMNKWFSFELFKEMPKITHLFLDFHGKQLNESILKEIDIYLPKLQYIFICDPFITDTKGVKQMAEILSRLSNLQTIILWFKPGVDYQPIGDMILEKCLKIKNIWLRNVMA